MSDIGSENTQQYAPADTAGHQVGPPPRPPMPGIAAHPGARPQQFSSPQYPAQPGPAPRPQAQPGPGQFPPQQFPQQQFAPQQFPAQQFPAQQGPRQPVPAQRRSERQRPAQPVQAQPGLGTWPSPQGSGPAWPAPVLPPAAPVDDPDPVPAPAPVRKRGRAGKVIGLLVVAAALGGVGWVVLAGSRAPVTAAVGDCVTQTGSDDIAIVACGEPSAQFRVAGRLENKTVIDASLFACSDFPDATSSFWQGVQGKPGTVLCLAPTKPAAPAAP